MTERPLSTELSLHGWQWLDRKGGKGTEEEAETGFLGVSKEQGRTFTGGGSCPRRFLGGRWFWNPEWTEKQIVILQLTVGHNNQESRRKYLATY